MNVAIGMWAVVLGGWVLPGPATTPEVAEEAIDPQPIRQFGSLSLEPERRPATKVPGTGVPGAGAGETAPQQHYRSPYSGRGGRTNRTNQTTPQWAPQMPLAPTAPIDPSAPLMYPWASPTTAVPQQYPGMLQPPGAATPLWSSPGAGSAYGGTPAAATGGYQSMYSPGYASRLSQSRGPQSRFRPRPSRPSLGSRKPFSGYRRPPAISPWVNLFRSDTVEGVDNFTAFVKPALEQGRANQRFSGEIRGLQSAARNQGAAMQGLSTPGGAQQYFMNHRTYFPTSPR